MRELAFDGVAIPQAASFRIEDPADREPWAGVGFLEFQSTA
jgi:hypothetical protein